MDMSDVAKNFNLIQIGNKWNYRRRVPKDLLAAFKGKNVIKHSLKTSDIKEARERRDIEEVKYNELFKKLRAKAPHGAQSPPQEVGNDEAKVLIRSYVARELKRFNTVMETDPPKTIDERPDMIEEQEFILQSLKSENHYAHEWISTSWSKLEDEAASQGMDLNANASLISHLLRALIEISNVKLNVLQYDYSRPFVDPAFAPQGPTTHSFKQLAKLYLAKYKESAKINDRAAKSIDKVIQNITLVVELVGPDTSVSSFDFDALEKTRFKLARVPTNYKKVFKGQSLDQAILLGAEKKVNLLSHKTQRQYLGALQQMLKLAVGKKWLTYLPSLDLKPVVEAKIKEKDKRRAFEVSQLTTFFTGPFYSAASKSDKLVLAADDFEWRYWLPLLALFSGMRGNEISLLLTSDIQKTEKGIYFFNITEEGAKSVKTSTSIRKIPIHDDIIALGFLDFVAKRRSESGNAKLFDKLKPDKYGNLFAYAGRRFNESFLPKEMGHLKRQSFHSFRHTFRDALRETNASPDTLQALGGWDQGSLTSSNYGQLSHPDFQKQFIDGVKFGDLNLSHLKKLNWNI